MTKRGRSTGRLMRWTKRGGWVVGWTPYEYHVGDLHFFQRLRFKGATLRRNCSRRPSPAT